MATIAIALRFALMTPSIAASIFSRALRTRPVSGAFHAIHRAGPAALTLVSAFIILSIIEGHSIGDIALGLSCGLFVLFAGFALFCLGWMTSADAKLVAGIAVWVGWGHLWALCLGALLVDLVLHPAFRWWRARPLPPTLSNSSFWQELHHRRMVPLSIGAGMTALCLYIGPVVGFGNLLGT